MGQYKVLSIKSHSNSYQTLKDVVDLQQNGQKKVINIELAWNVDDLSLALNHIDFIMRNYIYFVKEFLVKENKEWYEKLTDIEQGFYASFYSLSQSHPKNIFYKMCNEAIQKYQDILLRENQ